MWWNTEQNLGLLPGTAVGLLKCMNQNSQAFWIGALEDSRISPVSTSPVSSDAKVKGKVCQAVTS